MHNITFVIFTFNEEKRVKYVIKNFIKYGDVLIMDGGSNDNTKKIAEELGAKFVLRPEKKEVFGETQGWLNFIKDNIQTEWIYWGHVDNIAPKLLVEKMVEISKQDKFKQVLIPLYTYLWGNTKHHVSKGYTPFLFHKDFVDFSDNYIHGMGKFLGRNDQLLKLPNRNEFALKHFSVYDIHKFVLGHLNYAEGEAIGKFEKGKRFSTLKMLAGMARYWWIYRRSLKNGALGLIIVMSYSFFRLMAYAKLYELENDVSLESIENNYAALKEKILEDFK